MKPSGTCWHTPTSVTRPKCRVKQRRMTRPEAMNGHDEFAKPGSADLRNLSWIAEGAASHRKNMHRTASHESMAGKDMKSMVDMKGKDMKGMLIRT
jgi:hypothetical protein